MTFPTKFSERMRAAMFPQQNLKRREAFFCWARRRFAPAKCRNASPFVEVRQIEFLARETPNYTLPRTCTHIPSMDMRERERFASQERSDEENPQRCYDPSDDRDGTAGVPSTQPVLVREPTSAFSVRWGGSYCPLCSTPRNRGAAPRGKHHHTFLRIKV